MSAKPATATGATTWPEATTEAISCLTKSCGSGSSLEDGNETCPAGNASAHIRREYQEQDMRVKQFMLYREALDLQVFRH